MKLAVLLLTLAVFCGSVTSGNAKSPVETRNEELLERAASQLERLANFRRTRQPPRTFLPNNEERVFSTASVEETQTTDDIAEAQQRIDDLRATAAQLLRDPTYEQLMQDRTKRSFISGITNKLVDSVTSASGGSSRGSSGSSSGPPSAYGYYGYPYESKFDLWDIKKAIINTLIQAIKAIGGGALAGGGALVKGGGYLVAAKGRIISSAGDALASLGKTLASSATIAGPRPIYGPPAYSYNYPSPHTGQSYNYDGPPPSTDAYVGPEDAYNANYASPSNDDAVDEHAGVLIVKETKAGYGHGDSHEEPASFPHQSEPSLSALGESFAGPAKGPSSTTITKIVGLLTSGQPSLNTHESPGDQVNYYQEHKDQPSSGLVSDSSYQSGSLEHHQDTDKQNNHQDYQSNGQIYDSYGMKLEPSSPQLAAPQPECHKSNDDHRPSAYEDIREIVDAHLQVPKTQGPSIFRDPSSFADYQPYQAGQHQSEPLKIPILESQQNSLDHGSGGSFDYSGLPNYASPNYASASYSSPNYGSITEAGQTMIGLDGHGSHLPIIPDYNNYPLHTGLGFDHHIQHPAPGGPAVLSVWGRMTRRTSGQAKKNLKSNKALEIQRSIGYALKNSKLTRI